MKKRKTYMPAGYLGTKRMGELAELAFMFRAASEGIGVARPYGDSHPYDFLVQHGSRINRVQVKSCYRRNRPTRRTGFPVLTRKYSGKRRSHYSRQDIDFIAAYIASYETWYLIPVESLRENQTIQLYPGGKGNRSAAFYECYREAWHLLKDENQSQLLHENET